MTEAEENPVEDFYFTFGHGQVPGVPYYSVCGGQRLQCNCKGHDKDFAKWTGIWPGEAEAEYLGVDLNTFQRLCKIFFMKKSFPKRKGERNKQFTKWTENPIWL